MEIVTKQLTNHPRLSRYSVSNADGGIVWNQYGERLSIEESTKGRFAKIKGRRYYINDLMSDNF